MDHILFYLFSILEFTAAITLTLSIFMINIREVKSHIIFSAFILAQASYLMRVGANLESVSIVIQLLMLILLFRFVFRVQFFYAALMGVIGYLVGGLLQMLIIIIFSAITPYSLEYIVSNTHKIIGYSLQAITSITTFIISYLLRRNRLGFSFIPDNDTERIQLKGNNIRLLGTMIIGIILVSVYSYFFFKTPLYFLILTLILFVVTVVFVWLALKKEKQYD